MRSKYEVMAGMKETGVVVVLRVEGKVDLAPVAKALREGGIRFLEITMTMPGALDLIRETSQSIKGSDFFIGAGTVLDAETARLAILAGADFVVGPSFDPGMVALCHSYGISVIAGAMTPTEIVTAWKAGVEAVKIFPAKCVGGPDFLKAIKEPLPQVELLPTNGVDFQTAAAYIQAGAIAIGVGKTIVGKELIAKKDYATMTANARKLIGIIQEARSGMLP